MYERVALSDPSNSFASDEERLSRAELREIRSEERKEERKEAVARIKIYEGEENARVVSVFLRNIRAVKKARQITRKDKASIIFFQNCLLDGIARDWYDYLKASVKRPASYKPSWYA